MSWSIETAIRTLWQEARSETAEGRQAVTHSMYNRLNTGRWGHTLASVCLWHEQFSGWRSVDPSFQPSCAVADDDPLLCDLRAMVVAAAYEPDPTGGALFYYAPKAMPKDRPVPDWVHGDPIKGIKSATFCGQFGTQLFYKGI